MKFEEIPLSFLKKIEPEKTPEIGKASTENGAGSSSSGSSESQGANQDIFSLGNNTKTSQSDAPGNPVKNEGGEIPGMSNLGDLIEASTAINLFDVAIPAIIVWVGSKIEYKINKADLTLTAKEKSALEPATKHLLKAISWDLNNPYINFAIAISIVYGSKLLEKSGEIKKVSKSKNGETESSTTVLKEAELTKEEIFENAIVEEAKAINSKRKKGLAEAKEYLHKNFPEKIEQIRKRIFNE